MIFPDFSEHFYLVAFLSFCIFIYIFTLRLLALIMSSWQRLQHNFTTTLSHTPAFHNTAHFAMDQLNNSSDITVIIWRTTRRISIANPSLDPSTFVIEPALLSSFNFTPPYHRNDRIYLAPLERSCVLAGRRLIKDDDEDNATMDYRALFTHTSSDVEEWILIPVKVSFFADDFDLPLLPLPSALLSPSLVPLASHTYPPQQARQSIQINEAEIMGREPRRGSESFWAIYWGYLAFIIIIGAVIGLAFLLNLIHNNN